MLETKPLTKTIFVVLLLIAINNVLLLWFLGYFTDQQASATIKESKHVRVGSSANQSLKLPAPTFGALEDEVVVITPTNSELSDVDKELKRFMQSDTFVDVMDAYQVGARARAMTLEKELRDSDVPSLLTIALESKNQLQKTLALGILREDLNKLDATELKSLYALDDLQPWNRNAIIVALIDKGDIQALQWGKEQLVAKGDFRYGFHHELFESLYDKDPEYVRQFVSSVDISAYPRASKMVHLLTSKPELATVFFSNNFDQILNSEDNQLYQAFYGRPKLELSRSQQADLSSFFISSNRHKRSFAINLASNIEDTDLLRDSFYQLDKTREKLQFLQALSMNKKNTEQQELINEIVDSASDEAIKKFRTGQ